MGNIEIELELYLRTYRRTLLALIDEGIANGLIKSELDKDIIYHYIDMGVVYYQQSPEYRSKMLESNSYSQRFMQFFINNIFTDGARILTDTR